MMNMNRCEMALELGRAAMDSGDFSAALMAYQQALAIVPAERRAHFGVGFAYLRQGEWTQAETIFRELSLVWSDNPAVWVNLATVADRLSNYDEALLAAKQALVLSPANEEAGWLFGKACYYKRTYSAAVIMFKGILAQRGGRRKAVALSLLSRIDRYLCRWNNLSQYNMQMLDMVRSGASGAGVLDFFMVSDSSPMDHLRCAKLFAQDKGWCSPVEDSVPIRVNRHSKRPLRVGFLSSDFRIHAVSTVFVRVLELLDPQRLEVHAYSLMNPVRQGDEMRTRVELAVEYFHDVSSLSTAALAEKIRQDGVDVLVDLNGFTMGGCSEVFKYRIAPVTVSYLGFPGTDGVRLHDWIVADRFVIPEGEDHCYAEKVWRLPDSYMPTDNSRVLAAPPSRQALGLPASGFVFCCFNKSEKITPEVFDVWCDILRQVPDSVLWLGRGLEAEVISNLRREAETRGVQGGRLVFAPLVNSPIKHMERLGAADLALDTWPYNMHATCVDTLWAGVPVLTLKGRTFPGRVAESLLHAAGLPEMVANDERDYINQAVHLAMNPAALSELKSRVARARTDSALFDSAKMARSLEDALIGIYDDWLSNQLS